MDFTLQITGIEKKADLVATLREVAEAIEANPAGLHGQRGCFTESGNTLMSVQR